MPWTAAVRENTPRINVGRLRTPEGVAQAVNGELVGASTNSSRAAIGAQQLSQPPPAVWGAGGVG